MSLSDDKRMVIYIKSHRGIKHCKSFNECLFVGGIIAKKVKKFA